MEQVVSWSGQLALIKLVGGWSWAFDVTFNPLIDGCSSRSMQRLMALARCLLAICY
jgi:hypothetical protein